MRDILEIMTAMYPVKLRVSLGIGNLETELNPSQTLGMDGSPFHTARNGIDSMKKIDYSHIQIFTEAEPQELCLINRSLDLTYSAMKGWKKNTFTVLLDRLKGESLQDCAGNLNISVRGVYKLASTNLVHQHYDLLMCLEQEINKLI